MSLEDEARQSATIDRALADQVLKEGQELAALFSKYNIEPVTFNGGSKGWVLRTADRNFGSESSPSWTDGVAVLTNGEIHDYYYHSSDTIRGLSHTGVITDARYHQLLVKTAKAVISGSYQTPKYESEKLNRQATKKSVVLTVGIVLVIVLLICIVAVFSGR